MENANHAENSARVDKHVEDLRGSIVAINTRVESKGEKSREGNRSE